jgi:transcriptional regulator with XRE-family HTH domain
MSASPISKAIEARLMREPRTSGRRLALEIGVDKDTFSAWRRGKSTPRAYQLGRLAEALEVSVDSLMPADAPTSARGSPDLLSLLDELSRLSEVARAVAKAGEAAPDIARALREAKRLRKRLGE